MNSDINSTELNFRIDHLVFDGFSLTSYQQERLKESIETELMGIFIVKGIPKVNESAYAKIAADTIQLKGHPSDQGQLGKQIATSIYNGLKNLE